MRGYPLTHPSSEIYTTFTTHQADRFSLSCDPLGLIQITIRVVYSGKRNLSFCHMSHRSLKEELTFLSDLRLIGVHIRHELIVDMLISLSLSRE